MITTKTGLVLPRALSYSSLTLWKRDKKAFRRRYYEGDTSFSTAYTMFGKEIAEALERGEHPNVPKYKESEVECRVEIDGVPVLGYLDSFDPKKNRILEYKTGIATPDGKPRWTNLLVHKHDQLPFYSMLVEEKYGAVHKEVRLLWLETSWGEDLKEYYSEELGMTLSMNVNRLKLTGKFEMFKRSIDPWERDEMRAWVSKSAEEIAEDFALYLKGENSGGPIPREVREYFRELGRRAGRKNREKGSEYFRELQKKSVAKRKENKRLSTPPPVEE